MTPVEILEKYRIPFRRHGEDNAVREGYIGLHCPYCGRPEDKFYLGWNLSRGFMSCWSCGFVPAAKTLAEIAGIQIRSARILLGEVERGDEIDKSVLRGKYQEPAGIEVLRSAHRHYLKARGFNPRTVESLWGVRGIGVALKLQWRLFIPIHFRGEPVSWTTRTIGDREPRYISAPPESEKVSAKQILYGGDYVRHVAIITEGPLDVWAIGPGAVALSGLGYSPGQVLALSKVPSRVVCFDNEPAAQLRAERLCSELAPFAGTTTNVQIDGKDPASASKKEIQLLRKFLE